MNKDMVSIVVEQMRLVVLELSDTRKEKIQYRIHEDAVDLIVEFLISEMDELIENMMEDFLEVHDYDDEESREWFDRALKKYGAGKAIYSYAEYLDNQGYESVVPEIFEMTIGNVFYNEAMKCYDNY